MQSMTGFAAAESEAGGLSLRLEGRSVNARGLDLRFRLAEGFEALEPALRAAAGQRLARGAVSIALRVGADAETGAPALNAPALDAVIEAAKTVEAKASAAGLHLAPGTAAGLLGLRGVLEAGGAEPADEAAAHAVRATFDDLMTKLVEAREAEGARIGSVFAGLLDRIEALAGEAEAAFQEHQEGAAARLVEKVEALRAADAEVSPDRLAQELALLAVKADVREELDRLAAHIAAARELIAAPGPIGRKLDFLTQEFNREVNTLCSKSGAVRLTDAGLELKVVVDQMREQAQNIE